MKSPRCDSPGKHSSPAVRESHSSVTIRCCPVWGSVLIWGWAPHHQGVAHLPALPHAQCLFSENTDSGPWPLSPLSKSKSLWSRSNYRQNVLLSSPSGTSSLLTQPGHLWGLPSSVWSSFYELCLPLLLSTSLQQTILAASELRGPRSAYCSLLLPTGHPVLAKAAWHLHLCSNVKEGCIVTVLT